MISLIIFLVTINLMLSILIANHQKFRENVEPRIIGGKNAEKGQFPYQVSLRRVLLGSHFCGGSIISNRFILTAAHCATKEIIPSPSEIVAVLGTLYLDEGGVTMNIDKVTVHEKRSDKHYQEYDIALLRTAEEITFSEFIQPIALPVRDSLVEGTTAIFSGWGRTNNSFPQIVPNELKFTETVTITLNQCKKDFRKKFLLGRFLSFLLKETMVCTFKEKNVRMCNGDSGGPLVDITDPKKKSLIGIISWGAPNCMAGYPGVYTRVDSYIDWIQTKIDVQNEA